MDGGIQRIAVHQSLLLFYRRMEPMAESLLQISFRDGYIFSSNVQVKVFVSLQNYLSSHVDSGGLGCNT